mgnify:FL=1
MENQQKAGEVLRHYYDTRYFGDKAMRDPWVWVKLGPISFPSPNLRGRREIIHLHDLHHILTGFDTDWAGEGEVAAWELASGFPKGYRVGYLYAPITFCIGLIVAPRRLIQAFRRGLGKKNLCHLRLEKNQLLSMPIDDLKRDLSLN